MIDNQVVLVTGASRGIGAHLVEHFSKRGMTVVGCGRSAGAMETPGVAYVQADVTKAEEVKQLVARVREDFGRLDVLVNNAGTASMNAVLLMPTETIDAVTDTNFKGTVLVSREAVRLMRRHKLGGRIVNLTTVAVPLRLEGEAVYAAAKSAVEEFTRGFAREVAQFGITCNAVGPAPIETDLVRNVPRDKLDALVKRLAIKRMGTVEEVAHLIDFLIDPGSTAVTGQVIYLGGP